ncbi:hypothetical protein K1T71_001115 [Dendrolimus kikuchii]|uniref:Uncharacterized protein n=1 Tax=Dendrolimus kikuchii TaxID=765133 RepID=A0ACC1DGM7_9NEOP|nr:hypothetical protein K1T71_001115 [Dendrolimus kikuchii]
MANRTIKYFFGQASTVSIKLSTVKQIKAVNSSDSVKPTTYITINNTRTMALFCCGRLGSKSVLATLSRFPTTLSNAQFAQAAAGAPKITFKKFEPPVQEHHDVRNEKLNRPLSPHLTIYRFQLTAMLSITHRASGMILSAYASALGIGALVLPNDISHYIAIIESLNLSPASLFLLKALIASPLGYHFANGIRHLYWDTAKGLSIKEVYTTGYAMLGASALITLILAAL